MPVNPNQPNFILPTPVNLTQHPFPPNWEETFGYTVRFMRDSSWSGAFYDFQLNGDGVQASVPFTANNRFNCSSVTPNSSDCASWIMYRLPVGVCWTITNNLGGGSKENIGDLAGCGQSIDLIGTNNVETVDLVAVGANDCISGFFWRNVDTNNCVQLFTGTNFTGRLVTLFLDEWSQGSHSLSNWDASHPNSLYFNGLAEGDTVSFSSTGGQTLTLGLSPSDGNQMSTLEAAYQSLASFDVEPQAIYKIAITNCPATLTNGTPTVYESSITYSTGPTSFTYTINADQSASTSSTVSMSNTTTSESSLSESATFSASVGEKDVDSVSTEASVSVTSTYTASATNSTDLSSSTSSSVDYAVSFTVPPNCSGTATLDIIIYSYNSQVVPVTATIWYVNQPIGLSYTMDGNYYKVTNQMLNIEVAGAFVADTTFDPGTTEASITPTVVSQSANTPPITIVSKSKPTTALA